MFFQVRALDFRVADFPALSRRRSEPFLSLQSRVQPAILASARPVCDSHCLPDGLKEHPRNMSDEELRFIADRGGFIGVTMFPPFLRRRIHANVMDGVEAIDDTINLVGEDCVDIGTDFTQGSGDHRS